MFMLKPHPKFTAPGTLTPAMQFYQCRSPTTLEKNLKAKIKMAGIVHKCPSCMAEMALSIIPGLKSKIG